MHMALYIEAFTECMYQHCNWLGLADYPTYCNHAYFVCLTQLIKYLGLTWAPCRITCIVNNEQLSD